MITDSIAGERERQTLETLLASRLPDRAILLGKVAAITLLGWLLLALGALPGILHQALTPDGAVASRLRSWRGWCLASSHPRSC
jgi:ABC-type Na+ efflux pump permease subunit